MRTLLPWLALSTTAFALPSLGSPQFEHGDAVLGVTRRTENGSANKQSSIDNHRGEDYHIVQTDASTLALAPRSMTQFTTEYEPSKMVNKRQIQYMELFVSSCIQGGVFAVVAFIMAQALEALKGRIQHFLRDWNDARETYTCAMVNAMATDSLYGEAAVCVNPDYWVDHKQYIRGKMTVKLSLWPASVTYDCFWLRGPSTFALLGDGGFINICVRTGPCKYKKGLMTCPNMIRRKPPHNASDSSSEASENYTEAWGTDKTVWDGF